MADSELPPIKLLHYVYLAKIDANEYKVII